MPVRGLIEAGPVEPMQPPRMLGQMTKKRLVSIGLPGPTSVSHQPGLPVTGCSLATYWSPVSAWQTRMAFDLVGVERAVGLVGDAKRRQQLVAVEPQRLALGRSARPCSTAGGLAQAALSAGLLKLSPGAVFIALPLPIL